MTANGLGSPLVIKHMRQEEEEGGKPSQRDQWYWSMVSRCHRQWCWYLRLKIALSYNSTIKYLKIFQVPGWAVVLLCLAVAANVAVLVKTKKETFNSNKHIYMEVCEAKTSTLLTKTKILESIVTTCQLVNLTIWHVWYEDLPGQLKPKKITYARWCLQYAATNITTKQTNITTNLMLGDACDAPQTSG